MQDVRDAFRALRATPLVSAVAILSLALGIGANNLVRNGESRVPKLAV